MYYSVRVTVPTTGDRAVFGSVPLFSAERQRWKTLTHAALLFSAPVSPPLYHTSRAQSTHEFFTVVRIYSSDRDGLGGSHMAESPENILHPGPIAFHLLQLDF